MREDDERIRWRCRRGLLELDIVLSKFLNSRFDSLSESQKAVFKSLLDYADNDLWDLLNGRTLPQDPAVRNLLKLFE